VAEAPRLPPQLFILRGRIAARPELRHLVKDKPAAHPAASAPSERPMSTTPPPSRLFVISAPSGAGKTSLVKALLQGRPRLSLSVSNTTRAPRPHEVDGREYHFVSVSRFKQLIAEGAFLEHAQVFDNFYGTGRDQVEQKLAAGIDVVLEIDWQGARQVRRAAPDCVSIFILPPSRDALRQRLVGRGTDSPEVIARRLADAAHDMSHCPEFDFAVVNDEFDKALSQLGQILDGRGKALAASRAEIEALLPKLLA
jgi:guanylate kinase